MTTITVHSFKGGTGKSLIAVFLSYHFSKKKEKVLLIDRLQVPQYRTSRE